MDFESIENKDFSSLNAYYGYSYINLQILYETLKNETLDEIEVNSLIDLIFISEKFTEYCSTLPRLILYSNMVSIQLIIILSKLQIKQFYA